MFVSKKYVRDEIDRLKIDCGLVARSSIGAGMGITYNINIKQRIDTISSQIKELVEMLGLEFWHDRAIPEKFYIRKKVKAKNVKRT